MNATAAAPAMMARRWYDDDQAKVKVLDTLTRAHTKLASTANTAADTALAADLLDAIGGIELLLGAAPAFPRHEH